MRWGSRGVVIILLALAVGGVRDFAATGSAQDATPAARPRAGGSDSVTIRTFASGSLEIVSPGTAHLGLGRMTLAPDAGLPFDPTDSSAVLMYVTSGALTFRVDVPMTIAQRVEPGTPVPSAPDAVDANTDFTLHDGDSVLFPPAVAGDVRNDGADEATALVVNLAVLSQAASTPTP